jgi:hypothetical protein
MGMKVGECKVGDKVGVLADGVHLLPCFGGNLRGNQQVYSATVIGTSEHIVNGQATKHVILGWHENPFPSGKMPKEIEIDYNVMSRDKDNYRYKAFVSPDFYCEAIPEQKTKDDVRKANQKALLDSVLTANLKELQTAHSILTEALKKPLVPPKATLRQAKLNDRVRLQISDETTIEGTVFAVNPQEGRATGYLMIGFDHVPTNIGPLDTSTWPIDNFTTIDRQGRFKSWKTYHLDTSCEILPKTTLMDSKLGDRVRYRVSSTNGGSEEREGTVFTNPGTWVWSDKVCVGFEGEEGGGFPSAPPAKSNFPVQLDMSPFQSWDVLNLDTICEILPKAPEPTPISAEDATASFKQILRDAKLGDTVRYYMHDRVVEGTVIAGNPGSVHNGDLALVGFTASSKIPVSQEDRLYTPGNPRKRFRYYGHNLHIGDEYIASAAERLDTPCEIIPTIRPVEKTPSTIQDFNLGDEVMVQLGGVAVVATIIGIQPKSVFKQDYALLGFRRIDNIPSGESFITIKPDSTFTVYEHYVDNPHQFAAAKTLVVDTPCKLVERAEDVAAKRVEAQNYVQTSLAEGFQSYVGQIRQIQSSYNGSQQQNQAQTSFIWDGYAATGQTVLLGIENKQLPGVYDHELGFIISGQGQLNSQSNVQSNVANSDGYGWLNWTPTTWVSGSTIELTGQGDVRVWTEKDITISNPPGLTKDTTEMKPETPTPIEAPPIKITLAKAKLGDRVVIDYGGVPIEGTVVATGHPDYACVAYRANEKDAWFGKVVVGSLKGDGSYTEYAKDIGDFDCGTSFPLSLGCEILPKVESKSKEVKPLPLWAVLGAAAFAGAMKGLGKTEGIRVEEMVEDEVEPEVEEERHAETG